MAAQTLLSDYVNLSSLNIEGVSFSTYYINAFLSISGCELMCLQGTWFLDQNLSRLVEIHDRYLHTGKYGINSKDILHG